MFELRDGFDNSFVEKCTIEKKSGNWWLIKKSEARTRKEGQLGLLQNKAYQTKFEDIEVGTHD